MGTLHGPISLELFGYAPGSHSAESRLELAMQVIREACAAPTGGIGAMSPGTPP